MSIDILDRLFSSFSELESAINNAKFTLKSKENAPKHLMDRLNQYDGILIKQRALAEELASRMASDEWDEVNRLVSVINGLSSMIRDDARAILISINNNFSPVINRVEAEENYC